ncbi:hypothetical protein DL768_005413 [Monosporascus sp. mg162]|nr:hypothetical protein DL768_005413 [Monosporascus sp. mg162]
MDSFSNVPLPHYPRMSLDGRPGTAYSSMLPSAAPLVQGLSPEPYYEHKELQPSPSNLRSYAYQNDSKSHCAVVNDCARSRFWNRIAEIYLLDLDANNLKQEVLLEQNQIHAKAREGCGEDYTSHGTQSQGLEAISLDTASTPPTTAVTDLCDSFVNTDAKAGTIYPSDPQNDTGGFVSICSPSPTSQSATSSSNSNTSFESQKAEHEDLKCPNPDCAFRPSGKPENHKAYLRKHVQTHKNTKVKCLNCDKVYSRQDNATSHAKKAHFRTNVTGAKRRHRNEGCNSGAILRRKRTRSENDQANLWI